MEVEVRLRLTVGQSVSMSRCQAHSGTCDQILLSVRRLSSCLCGAAGTESIKKSVTSKETNSRPSDYKLGHEFRKKQLIICVRLPIVLVENCHGFPVSEASFSDSISK
jgi:hypothetical protein